MGQLLSLGTSHPTKSLLGFPFPDLLAKENRLFMLIYGFIILSMPVASSELQLLPNLDKWEIKRKPGHSLAVVL